MRSADLPNAAWTKSSYSANGGNCVEVAVVAGLGSDRAVAVRDSRDPQGAVLLFSPAEWRAFTDGVQSGSPA
jgi:hypothetical protein